MNYDVGLRERLESRIENARKGLALLDRFGEDDFENGSVITFKKKFNPQSAVYTYAAIKVDGLWYTTGLKSSTGYAWDALCEFMAHGGREFFWASELEAL